MKLYVTSTMEILTFSSAHLIAFSEKVQTKK